MKKILTLALAFSCGAALAQKADNVGIGTTKPDPSAILDLNSNTKGLLLPRMNQAQRDAIKNPAAGLVIFQTDQVVGTYTFDGTAWQPSNARTSAVSSVGAWDKQGNVIDGTDFLGSTNNEALRFKVNNNNSGLVEHTGSLRTFLGYQSGLNTTGQYNTAFGWQALLNNTTGQSNVAVGTGALTGATGSNNIGIGVNVLHGNGASTGGNDNVAIGHFSTFKNTAGSSNVGIGFFSLYNNTLGSHNLAVGTFAMENSNSGTFNVGIGSSALRANTSGSNNMAIGANALGSNTGSNNVAIGAQALRTNTGSGSVAIGGGAGENETGSNMLYISNSNTANPLIKGQFYATLPSATTPWLRINLRSVPGSPTPSTVGYLAIGDFDTAPGGAGAGGLALPSSFSGGPYRLYVQDGIMTEKLKVALRNSSDWADYVFAPNYKLMPLNEVEKYVSENKHLPNIPSAEEMSKNGLDVMQTSAKLMEKIEELTLYVIELNKEIQALKKQNAQK
ncbi:hypothetical protein GVN20_09120 [Runella sp. CRIBMP]|uniref:hypothetical protein n=1 Tax=Runella sp. CRIBMP TaxID=2683261 RepID=UPI0014129CCE|nr:hypothetical protein [Runella sp. CRIBMP]NBB19509.1 hypothetical protein [Runella sp. CRIBMP]